MSASTAGANPGKKPLSVADFIFSAAEVAHFVTFDVFGNMDPHYCTSSDTFWHWNSVYGRSAAESSHVEYSRREPDGRGGEGGGT